MGLEALHVLVVDDHRPMRIIVRSVLRGFGIGKISEAGSGAEALHAVAKSPVDFAIVDYRMADTGGIEFTKTIRTGLNTPNRFLPVIMLTGHVDRTRLFRARDAGVTELLCKPLVVRDLGQRIDTLIRRPRPYASASSYFGPDRRRRTVAIPAALRRRATDYEATFSEFVLE